MTYHEKMIKAIESAEKWQAVVDRLEQEAEAEAKRVLEEESRRLKRPYPSAVLIHRTKVGLKDDILYAQATGNRNAQQTLANMYAQAALVVAAYGLREES